MREWLKAASGTARSRDCACAGRPLGPPAPPRWRRRAGWRRGRAAGCPAMPSSAALKLALSSRSEKGDSSSISRHQRTVSSSSSSRATTVFTSPMRERVGGRVLAAQKPDLLGLLLPDLGREQGGAVAAVEAAHPRSGLAEAGVVGGDGEVAHHMQHLSAADGVAGHHGHDRLGRAPHLHVQVGYVEAAHLGAAGHIAGVAAHALVAARAEGQRALAGEDDGPDRAVLARVLEGAPDLDQRLGAEGVAHLGAVDGDLGDAVSELVADVVPLARRPRASPRRA